MSEPASSGTYTASAHLRFRLLKDRLVRAAVAAGGIGVIVSILLIFIYLLYVVLPLGKTPGMHEVASYEVPSSAPVLHLAMEEQAEIGALFNADGLVRFFSTRDGSTIKDVQLPLPFGARVASFSSARPNSGVVALGLDNGQALVVRHRYKVTFPNDQRQITPVLEYPLGRDPIHQRVVHDLDRPDQTCQIQGRREIQPEHRHCRVSRRSWITASATRRPLAMAPLMEPSCR